MILDKDETVDCPTQIVGCSQGEWAERYFTLWLYEFDCGIKTAYLSLHGLLHFFVYSMAIVPLAAISHLKTTESTECSVCALVRKLVQSRCSH